MSLPHHDPQRAWTPEQDAELRRMWASGLSASQIAATKLCGDRSRNSIIGRVHRLDLEARAPRPSKAAYQPREPRSYIAKAARPKEPPPPPEPPRYARGSWGCQYIEGDPREGAPMCGERRISKGGKDSSYCAAHHARAFTPAYRISEEDRERRRELGRRNIARWNARASA